MFDELPLSFESPESSTLLRADYDPKTLQLSIVFKSGGTYDYHPFPEHLWIEFEGAASKGKFFQTMIRPMYAGTKRETSTVTETLMRKRRKA